MTALYIHWPFCASKCPYCDFNSHVRDQIDESKWHKAYMKNMQYIAEQLGERNISSIFFGGGTPSLMPTDLVEDLISNMPSQWKLDENCEITLEANPGSVEVAKLAAFKQAGVNRLSMGVQSLRDDALKFLGREHSAQEALEALEVVKNTFDRYSFDLIYARPNQSLEEWREELSEALQYVGDHFSLYQLTIEKGTPFYSDYQKGKWQLPEDEVSADMYELTNRLLAEKGLMAYEVSNYAKPTQESRHNVTYWNYGEYIGIGAGAHSRVIQQGKRHAWMMWHSPEKWLEHVEADDLGLQQTDELPLREQVIEAMMMMLRLQTGLNYAHFKATLGVDIQAVIPEHVIKSLVKEKLLMSDDSGIKTTAKGRMVLTSITEMFVQNLMEI